MSPARELGAQLATTDRRLAAAPEIAVNTITA